ncbi:MAG: type II toxin-antitoxin system VapC family toxin [Ramlibacter sp.]|nr:type II toxin-antitoxin system VapC family toxin [Ramlibacter sp.]
MLDTNICIYLLKGGWKKVSSRFAEFDYGDLLISAVVYGELRAGVELSARRDSDEAALLVLLSDLVVAPFDERAATSFGVLRAQVPGRQRNAMDRLIAAHALSLDATLVTNNPDDFRAYAGLTLENWV